MRTSSFDTFDMLQTLPIKHNLGNIHFAISAAVYSVPEDCLFMVVGRQSGVVGCCSGEILD